MNRTRLRALLVKHEGLKLKPYTDTAGKLTIGVGRCLETTGITEDEAMVLLDNDINDVFHGVSSAVACFGGLDEARQHVLLDIAFNVGVAGLQKFHKMLDAVEGQHWDVAASEIIASTLAPVRARDLAAMMKTGSGSGS